jgi:hypothetical protein
VHRRADEELVGLAHHVGTSMPALFKLELDKLREDNAKLQSREVLIQCRLRCVSVNLSLIHQRQMFSLLSVTEILESDITELPVSESVELVLYIIDHCPLHFTWQEILSDDLKAVTDKAMRYAEMLQTTKTAPGGCVLESRTGWDTA